MYTQPGSNWRPSACRADVIATRPWVPAGQVLAWFPTALRQAAAPLKQEAAAPTLPRRSLSSSRFSVGILGAVTTADWRIPLRHLRTGDRARQAACSCESRMVFSLNADPQGEKLLHLPRTAKIGKELQETILLDPVCRPCSHLTRGRVTGSRSAAIGATASSSTGDGTTATTLVVSTGRS